MTKTLMTSPLSVGALKAIRQETPHPKWQRVKLPENIFELPTHPVKITVHQTDSGAQIYPLELNHLQESDALPLEKEVLEKLWHMGLDPKRSGFGLPFSSWTLSEFNHGALIVAKANQASKIVISHGVSEGSAIGHYLVVAEEGSRLELVLDYAQGEGPRAMLYSQVSVLARPGSQTRVVNVQRLGEVAGSFQSVCTEIEEGASVVLGDIQLGSGFKASSASQRLAGRHAQAKTYGLYFTGPSEQADLQYTHNHVGKRTQGHILAKGAMEDQSKKVFRGNLVFDRGSTASVGKEEEFVMLLSEHLKSDSIPGLFCEEDDVIGEHAASIGQVDTDKLFYLMSRGFRESAARKLLVHAAFEEVLLKLEVPFVSSLVGEVIERAFEGGRHQ
jgi:Fe-S cluster assembly protein SufD